MILIGQYDSPFVRRVGIALSHYGFGFEHRPWSVFGDTDRLGPLNPVVKVPTLVLDEGEVLTDSHIILNHLDSLVDEDRRLVPLTAAARRQHWALTALATGAADAAVSLFYELYLHEKASDMLIDRRKGQIAGSLAAIEQKRGALPAGPMFESRLSHADIALVAAWRFISEAHGKFFDAAAFPSLSRHAGHFEALPLFGAISQSFVAPA